MSLATWWYADPRPEVPGVPGLQVQLVEGDDGDEALRALAGLPQAELARRRAEGHRPYGAYVDGVLAAYGWVATRRAAIGELGLDFELAAGNRYLWDFATGPAFRGKGIYPHLLSAIIEHECPPATRLWIIHAPENLPSGIGISRAGFEVVAELSFDAGGHPSLLASGSERAHAGSALLGLPLSLSALSPCWRCGSLACVRNDAGGCACEVQPHR